MPRILYKTIFCAILICGICKSCDFENDPATWFRLPDEQIFNISRITLPVSDSNRLIPFPLQNVPTEAEQEIFLQKIDEMKKNSPDGLNLIIGDQGSSRFLDNMSSAIFIDPLIKGIRYKGGASDDEMVQKFKPFLFIKSTLSDFLYFLDSNEKFQNAFEKSIKLIFDDWSIIVNENRYNYGGTMDPIHVFELREKINRFCNLLIEGGKIVSSSISFTGENLDSLIFMFKFSIFTEDVRKNPITLEKREKTQKDLWLLNPKGAFVSVFNRKKIGHFVTEEMEYWGMSEDDYNRLKQLFLTDIGETQSSFRGRMIEMSLHTFDSDDSLGEDE